MKHCIFVYIFHKNNLKSALLLVYNKDISYELKKLEKKPIQKMTKIRKLIENLFLSIILGNFYAKKNDFF